MGKVSVFLDIDDVEFDPELREVLFKGEDESMTVVALFKKMDLIYDRYCSLNERGRMNESDMKTLEAMEKYGGSFVSHLATAARHADPVNLQKIKATFSEYWREYKEMAELK